MIAYYNFEEQGEGQDELWNRAAGNPFDQAREDFEPEFLNGRFREQATTLPTVPTNPPQRYERPLEGQGIT